MNSTLSPEELLAHGCEQLGLSLSADVQQNFFLYLEMMLKWNRVHNLTAITEPKEVVVKHFLDSLAVAPHLHGNEIIDIGSGGGLPGIPLALACPDKHFVLLDSRSKRTTFLLMVKQKLGLSNVDVITSRVEAYKPEKLFSCVTARAFKSIGQVIEWAEHLLLPDGCMLLMKSKDSREDFDEVDSALQLKSTITLEVPFLDAERHLIALTS